MRIRIFVAIVCVTLSLPAFLLAQAPQADAVPEITNIQGDLYRVRAGQRDTVFLVTGEGIILADPISVETATWLKKELAERFPGRPVRFVLHTDHHFDRAEGAFVLSDTAEVVAHRNFAGAVSADRSAWPAFLGIVDRNRNGVLDAAEIADSTRSELLRAKDRNGAGRVRPSDLYARVQEPETTYDDRRTISLGGRTVELVYTGRAHVPDMTALYFPSERVVFVAEAPVKDTRLELGSDSPRDVMRWLATVGQIDFDLGITGDGRSFSAATVHELSAYFKDLVDGVSAGRAAGLSLADVEAKPFLESYVSKPFAVDRARHIEAVYRTVRVMKVEVTGAAVANYAPHAKGYCEGYTSCSDSKAVPLGLLGFGVSGLRMGVWAEFTAGDQTWNVQTGPFLDEEFAARSTRGAVLFRLHGVRRGFLSAMVGGLSVTQTNISGMTRQKEAYAPTGGLRAFTTDFRSFGVTGGVDLARSFAGRYDLVIPIRVTRRLGEANAILPLGTDVQIGVGLSYAFSQRVN